MDISVAITTYSEGEYLDSLLSDLERQDIDDLQIEIIILEAGNYTISRATKHLGAMTGRLNFINRPGLSRTESLNYIFKMAKGQVIVRLDARSHISATYLKDIFKLSMDTGAENVGGVMVPIGRTKKQELVANIMKHPLSLGGAKSRNQSYRGIADSVYLGAFNKEKCVFGDEWFDSKHPKISEDSDLNYRLRLNGGKVFVDSAIKVEHFPRESLGKFFRLCLNYGVGRGLFIIKHRVFSAYRQVVPPLAFATTITLLIAGFYYPPLHYTLALMIVAYSIIITLAAYRFSKGFSRTVLVALGFAGCHLFWTIGLIISPFVYRRDLINLTTEKQA